MPSNNVKREKPTDEYWLNKMYRKSESEGTQLIAKTSLSTFEYFCQKETGLNGKSMPEMIEKYQEWYDQDRPDIQSICMSLDKFIEFMGKDHDEIRVNVNRTFKAKHPKTLKVYFGFIKSYLRICHGIKLTTEDIRDYVTFPKPRKEPRRAISLDTLKLIFGKCDRTRRALYYGFENKNLKSSKNKLQRIETLLVGLNVSNSKKIVGKIMKSKMSSIKADLELLSDLKPMNKNIFRKYIDDLEWTSRRSPRELDSEILELLDEGSYSNQELSALLNTSKALISKSMNRLKINNEILLSSHGTRGSNYYTTNCDNCPFGKDKDECRYDAEKSIKDSLKTKFNFEIPQNDLKSITTNQAVLQIRTILDDTQKHQTPKMEVNINQNLNSIFSSVMANLLTKMADRQSIVE